MLTSSPTRTRSWDARVSFVVLLVFSCALFWVHSWWVLLAYLFGVLIGMRIYGLRLTAAFKVLIPLWIMLGVSILFSSFALSGQISALMPALGDYWSGLFDQLGWDLQTHFSLIGSWGFFPAGALRGVFFAGRIACISLATLLVIATTSERDIIVGLTSLLHPFSKRYRWACELPVTIALTLAFIPMIYDEFLRVAQSSRARGAALDEGAFIVRLRAWTSVFSPMFIGLFRRAERIARALDARAFGAAPRTTLTHANLHASEIILGCVLCIGFIFAAYMW